MKYMKGNNNDIGKPKIKGNKQLEVVQCNSKNEHKKWNKILQHALNSKRNKGQERFNRSVITTHLYADFQNKFECKR